MRENSERPCESGDSVGREAMDTALWEVTKTHFETKVSNVQFEIALDFDM